MRTIRLLFAMGAVVGVLLLIAACGGDDDVDEDAPDTTDRTEAWVLDLWGAPSGEVYAVGWTSEDPVTQSGVAFSLDHGVWRPMALPADIVTLVAIWGFSATDVFTVGQACDWTTGPAACFSVILHFDGSAWERMDIPAAGALYDLWGSSPSLLWAVGGDADRSGTGSGILRYDGADWSVYRTGDNERSFTSIWGNSAENVYAVSRTHLLHFDGDSWTPVELPEPGEFDMYFHVWGIESDLYLFGGLFSILHYDGSTWEKLWMPPGIEEFSAAWGASPSDVYWVGHWYWQGGGGIHAHSEGTVTHFDGRSFSTWKTSDYRFLTGIWGSSPSNLYVGGESVILHYDGTEFAPMPFAR